MLVELRVENLAVIERASARFGSRFNAITGETGAGKSILLSALGLALGGRADPDLVRRGAERAVSAAAFDDPPIRVAETCRTLGVVVEETLVLSRELSASGRSGARANGATVPATALRDLGAQLVDVQGQGASSLWLREAEQRSALDSLGGEEAAHALRKVGDLWSRRLENQAASERLRALQERQRGDLEQARRDLAELGAADLRAGEDVQLRQERDRLAHAARLREAAQEVRAVLSGESGAADRLATGLHAARGAKGIDPELDLLLDQAES
ncbi:MAG: AAA family ATPase, partial [Candidatus Dormiibacterota bacterium]